VVKLACACFIATSLLHHLISVFIDCVIKAVRNSYIILVKKRILIDGLSYQFAKVSAKQELSNPNVLDGWVTWQETRVGPAAFALHFNTTKVLFHYITNAVLYTLYF
jgi:hypothetical protein